ARSVHRPRSVRRACGRPRQGFRSPDLLDRRKGPGDSSERWLDARVGAGDAGRVRPGGGSWPGPPPPPLPPPPVPPPAPPPLSSGTVSSIGALAGESTPSQFA